MAVTRADLDRLDLKLLMLLQENNQQTSEELGERVGLSPTSCLRRLRRLRESGAIMSDVSIVAPSVTGKRVTSIVLVALEQEHLPLLDTFKSRMSGYPEVTQCYYVTGAADFVLVVNTDSMEEYGAFTERAFFPDKNIKSFTTFVAMQTVKFTTRINLDVS
ncbi:Lrp/AsnC family transcriptional regulator [Bradyrhizobium sp. DN5]|uniref:Lrp/AsnC family transcriptional regulator n=1 Tax=Bradyrhizobium sp. DN5 TaxID=3056950 RepID=UPI0035259ECD